MECGGRPGATGDARERQAFEEAKKEVQFSLGYFGWFAERRAG